MVFPTYDEDFQRKGHEQNCIRAWRQGVCAKLMPSVLIADDNPFILETLAARLRRNGYHVSTAANGQEAVERGFAVHPDLAILDASMPVMNGLEAAELLHQKMPRLPIILFTAYADVFQTRPHQSGVIAVFDKSSSLSDLLDTVDESLHRNEKLA